MKRIPLHITLLFLLGLLSVPDMHAQDATRNYVMTKTMHDAAGSNVVKDIQYFDDLGRPTLQSNDGLGKGQFFFFLYDGMGRLAIRGTCSNFNYHHYQDVTIQNGQDGLYGTGYVFSNPSSITHGFPEEVIYYDDYSFLSKTMFTSSPYCTALTMSNPVSAMGLQTGSIRRTSNNEYLLTAVYYDNKGRVIDKRETLLSGGVRKTLTTYSFTGKPLTETFVLTRNNTTTTVTKTRTYHAANDLVASLSLSYNNASPVTVARYDYDDLGRLSTLHRGGSAGNVTYTYNQRGWTNTIIGTGFKEWLYYTDGVGTPCYSGNLSSQLWQGGSETFKRGYKFSYDDLSRMTRADYGEGDNLTDHTWRYSEVVLEYMRNGGIRKLERYGKKSGTTYGKIDNLRMYYHGMQVDSVKEDALPLTYTGAFDFVSKTIPTGGVQYSYYDDGSLRWDANKGVTRIDYSRFGYPERVQFHNGNVTEYAYTPDGEKHRVIYRTAVPNISVSLGHTYNLNNSNTLSVDSINYVGDFIFENGQLTKFLFEGGYATIANGQPTYHLGNNRAVVNHNGTVEQVVHYYPFGAVYSDAGTDDALQRYKYNGKELDRMHGLNQYDYGARNYDPLMCRFTQIDPLAEKYYDVSPYAYCENNPVLFIDPKGMEKIDALDPNNEKNKAQIKAAESFSDEKNIVNVWAHGSPNGMTVYDKENGTTHQIKNAKSFANFLNKNSNVWKNRNESQNVTIVLHSCETGLAGKSGKSFAQKLSEGLDNVTIIAPTGNVYTPHGKELGTYKSSVEQNRTEDGKIVFSSEHLGKWIQYEDGQQTVTYNGNTHPGEKGYNIVTSQSSLWDNLKHFISNLF